MSDFAEKGFNPINEAIKRLDMNILLAQLTFVKTLTEGFDPTACDTRKGFRIIGEMCQTGSEEFARLQMEDEAQLLVHLKNTLTQDPEKRNAPRNPENTSFNRGMDLQYKIEAATTIIVRLIERIEDELNRNNFRCCMVAA